MYVAGCVVPSVIVIAVQRWCDPVSGAQQARKDPSCEQGGSALGYKSNLTIPFLICRVVVSVWVESLLLLSLLTGQL